LKKEKQVYLILSSIVFWGKFCQKYLVFFCFFVIFFFFSKQKERKNNKFGFDEIFVVWKVFVVVCGRYISVSFFVFLFFLLLFNNSFSLTQNSIVVLWKRKFWQRNELFSKWRQNTFGMVQKDRGEEKSSFHKNKKWKWKPKKKHTQNTQTKKRERGKK